MASASSGTRKPKMAPTPGTLSTAWARAWTKIVGAGQSVRENAAADQEHGRGPDHRERFHQPGCGGDQRLPETPLRSRPAARPFRLLR